jgi:hypothetical protein
MGGACGMNGKKIKCIQDLLREYYVKRRKHRWEFNNQCMLNSLEP